MSELAFASDAPRRRDLAWWLGFTAVLILITKTIGALPSHPAWGVVLLLLAAALQLRRGNLLRVIPVTLGLASAILATHAVIDAAWGADGAERIAEAGAVSLRQVLAGELWRIPAHVFLHDGWDHVTSNAILLLGLGMMLEPALGSRRFAKGLLFVFATATGTQMVFAPGGYGFSGITCGLHGMLLARPYRVGTNPRRSLDPAWILAVWFFVRYFLPSQFSFEFGFAGHTGGLIGGLWFGCVRAGTTQPTRGRRKMILRLAMSSAVTLALVGAFATSPRWALMWHARAAYQAEYDGDQESARRHWATVERLAKAGAPVDAAVMIHAVEYPRRQGAAASRNWVTR